MKSGASSAIQGRGGTATIRPGKPGSAMLVPTERAPSQGQDTQGRALPLPRLWCSAHLISAHPTARPGTEVPDLSDTPEG